MYRSIGLREGGGGKAVGRWDIG